MRPSVYLYIRGYVQLQKTLLESSTLWTRVEPAPPAEWEDRSFWQNLRYILDRLKPLSIIRQNRYPGL